MIRASVRSDAAAIAEIWNDVIRSSTITFTTVERTEADIAALLSERVCLVAEAAGRVSGFATFGPFRGGPGYRFTAEHSVHVRPEAQGSGLGRALLEALEDEARAAGVRVLVAGIGGENAAAQAFHERLGFRTEGHLTGVGFKFDRSHDLILMTKNL